jgi:hypothetical protein
VGNQTPDCFGSTLSAAGDVNGDGYADLVVGAGYYDQGGGAHKGRAYVFYGSTTGLACGGNCAAVDPDAVAAWKTDGENAVDGFGDQVATVGDINKDGYADVAVGARSYDVTGTATLTDAGRVYVYLGSSAGLATTAAFKLDGDQAAAEFFQVANAGDVNGDGYSDLLVGARLYDNGQTDEGRVFVYYSNTLVPITNLVATTTGTELYAGGSISVALTIQNANNLYAAQATCHFTPTVLLPQSGVFGDFFDPDNRLIGANIVSPTVGTWTGAISQRSPALPLSGNGLFATVTYTATSPGTTTITCNPLLSDRDGLTQTVFFSGTNVTVLPFATISGTAEYQGRPIHAGITVTATGPVTRTAVTTDTGSFVLDQLKAGTYTVTADAASYLPNCITPTVTSGQVMTLTPTVLKGGDANDDRVINIGDASLVAANFGLTVPPGDPRADINGDGVVNIQDLAILGGNYGLAGCLNW